ncbi:MAG: hypothetical protein ACKVS8_05320 [Phycisphaerales bacterium]
MMQLAAAALASVVLSELAIAQVAVTSTDAIVQASGFLTNNLGQNTNLTLGGTSASFATLNQSFTNPLVLPAGQRSDSAAAMNIAVTASQVIGSASASTSVSNVPAGLVLGVAQGISQLSVKFTVSQAVSANFQTGFAGGANAGAFVQIATPEGTVYFSSEDQSTEGSFAGVKTTLPPGEYELIAATSAISDISVIGGAPGSGGWNFDLRFVVLPPCPVDYNNSYVLDPDDLGDFITDYFSDPPLPGPGGFATPCPQNDPPYHHGYRCNYTSNGSAQCSEPYPDNVGDFITDYFLECEGY